MGCDERLRTELRLDTRRLSARFSRLRPVVGLMCTAWAFGVTSVADVAFAQELNQEPTDETAEEPIDSAQDEESSDETAEEPIDSAQDEDSAGSDATEHAHEPQDDAADTNSYDSSPPDDESGYRETQPESYPPETDLEPTYEPSDEPPGVYSGPFSKGSLGLTLMIGSASVGDSDYLVLGAGASYFVLDGLSLGLDADVWFLDDPTVYTTTPQLRYVLYFVPVLKPYVGTFYRHYFFTDGFDDLDSVGVRLGGYFVSDSGSYLGIGAIYERFLACDDTYWQCDGWYPELTFGFSL